MNVYYSMNVGEHDYDVMPIYVGEVAEIHEKWDKLVDAGCVPLFQYEPVFVDGRMYGVEVTGSNHLVIISNESLVRMFIKHELYEDETECADEALRRVMCVPASGYYFFKDYKQNACGDIGEVFVGSAVEMADKAGFYGTSCEHEFVGDENYEFQDGHIYGIIIHADCTWDILDESALGCMNKNGELYENFSDLMY